MLTAFTFSLLFSFVQLIHGQQTFPSVNATSIQPVASEPASTSTFPPATQPAASQPAASTSGAVAPPTCVQPRGLSDPAGPDITAVLFPAVSSACDPNQQQTAVSGDGLQSITYFETGAMFLNISIPLPVESLPIGSSCTDHFNAIIGACVDPNGQFWGGWTVEQSTNWSISNFVYPANGLQAAGASGTPSNSALVSTDQPLSTGAVSSTNILISSDSVATKNLPSSTVPAILTNPAISSDPVVTTNPIVSSGPAVSSNLGASTNDAASSNPATTSNLVVSSNPASSDPTVNTNPVATSNAPIITSEPPVITSGAPVVTSDVPITTGPGGVTSAPASQPTLTAPIVSSVTDAFSGTESVTSFPLSGGGNLVYTKSTLSDLGTITAMTTITTDVVETISGGAIYTYHGPVIVAPGGSFWGPPGIPTIPTPPGISPPCIWPFCTGSGGGGGGGGDSDPDNDNQPSTQNQQTQQQSTQPQSTQQPSSTEQPSSTQESSCTQKTVTDFWVSCSTGTASASCTTYSSEVEQGCTVTAETITTAVACSAGGDAQPDEPFPAEYNQNAPDFPTPNLSAYYASVTNDPDYLTYTGDLVSGTAVPGSTVTSSGASSTKPPSTVPSSTNVASTGATSTAASTTSAPAPTSTEASPICYHYADPHAGLENCQCSSTSGSSTSYTSLPILTGSSDICGYTALPAPVTTSQPPTTQGPEYPFTYTDLNYGPIIACKSSSLGNAGGIAYTVCEGDSTTVGTDTAIAAHHSSFAASISRAQASSAAAASRSAAAAVPTGDCYIYDSAVAYHFIVKNINGWAGDDGGNLKQQEKGCGALTGWKWYGTSAEFYLPILIRGGCVEDAIKSAGGPSTTCHGGGIGKREAPAGSLRSRTYSNAKRAEAAKLEHEEMLRKYQDEVDVQAAALAVSERDLAERGITPSKIYNWLYPQPPTATDLPVEWWEKATIPGVDQCNDNIRRKNQVARFTSAFYTNLGENGYDVMINWLKNNECITGKATHWNLIVANAWQLQISLWITRPYGPKGMQTSDDIPNSMNNKFLNHLSQAFGESAQGDAYFFMPAGSGAWNDDSAWGSYEYPALTRNSAVRKIWRVNLDMSDENNPVAVSRDVIHDKDNGDGPSPIEPQGLRDRSNPDQSPLTYVAPTPPNFK